MPKISAGLLVYRKKENQTEVLLVHPGGPFWAKKDRGIWSIPKGETNEGEDLLEAAEREFEEELGCQVSGIFSPLGSVIQKSGKIVHSWAIEEDLDISFFKSNTFELEWPPKSGKIQKFPEIDQARYFNFNEAKEKINPAQIKFLDTLAEKLGQPGQGSFL